MKRFIISACALALICSASLAMAEPVVISISQFVEHPALDSVLAGFQDDLAENGVEVEYHIYNAQGNMSTTTQIANQIIDDHPDMVVAIATPSAQACAAVTNKTEEMSRTPLLFTAITDPLLAGLVDFLEHPPANITGVSNQMPMGRHLDMIRELMPDLKVLGVIYNSGEMNSVSNVERLEAEAATRGIEIMHAAITTSSAIPQAAKSLVGHADAMYVPTDNTVVANIEAVIKVGQDAQLPLFCADNDSVEKGVIAAMAFDYYLHGKQTGAMARRILAGALPSETPVEFQENLQFHLNLSAAAAMGLEVSQELIDKADVVYE